MSKQLKKIKYFKKGQNLLYFCSKCKKNLQFFEKNIFLLQFYNNNITASFYHYYNNFY